MCADTFEILRSRESVPEEAVLHHHDFCVLEMALSGSAEYNLESRTCRPTPGDVLLISPLELHQLTSGEAYERITLRIDRNYLRQFCLPEQDVSACFSGGSTLLRPDGAVRELLAYLLWQLLAESESRKFAGELYSMGCLAQILVLVNRLFLQTPPRPEASADTGSTIYRVLRYINDHFSEELTLDLLAARFFISKYHLSREFSRLMGTSVYRYIVKKRLVMAKQMLSDGLPPTEVYQHCGFGDYSSFFRAFKTEYLVSPREFTDRIRHVHTPEASPFPRESGSSR